MTDLDETRSSEYHRPVVPEKLRRPTTMPWRRVLGLMAASLAIWMVLDSTTLQHNAQVSPVGIRRTVALDLLGPIAAVSRVSQLSRIESMANSSLGRSADGAGGGQTLTILSPAAALPVAVIPTGKHHPPIHPSITMIPANSMRFPTSSSPLRVLLIGDSLGLDLGGSLQSQLAATNVVTAALDGKESTGLTRPDYFNWPAELSRALPAVNPQVVVVMMGANDPQNIPGSPSYAYGTQAWDDAYRLRVESFMRLAASNGAYVIWVSLPPMRDPDLNARVAHINDLQKQAAATVPQVIYVNSTPIIGGPGGGYAPYITVNGQNVNVRTPDGTHISPDGGSVLGRSVINLMRQRLGIELP